MGSILNEVPDRYLHAAIQTQAERGHRNLPVKRGENHVRLAPRANSSALLMMVSSACAGNTAEKYLLIRFILDSLNTI